MHNQGAAWRAASVSCNTEVLFPWLQKMKTLRNITSLGARYEWDAIYAEKGKVKSLHVKGDDAGVIDARLQGFNKADRQLLLVVRLQKGFLKSKYSGQVHQLSPIKSLSWRHNLHVFLRNSYANGEELSKEVEDMHHAEDRVERMRTYRIEDRPLDLYYVIKEIKNNVTMKPIVLSFSSANRTWEQQRDFFVSVLVDYEQQIQVMEVEYDNYSPNKLAVQDIFLRFKVRRVPAWVMATPVKRENKAGIQVTRFDVFRDAYFDRQQSQGRPPMSAQKQTDVEEAFNSFILWGLKQVASMKSNETISF